MKRRSVPKEESSIFYTRVDVLRPSDPPLSVEPAADNNVMKITEDCLFMRTAFGSMYGGRRSMSWWAVAMAPFIFVFFCVCTYAAFSYQQKYESYSRGVFHFLMENWDFPVGAALFSVLSCFWMFIPWRTQLPIIFNRKTRKVTCVIRGKWVSQSWDHVEAYIKDVTTLAVSAAPANEGVLTLAFPYADPEQPRADGRLRVGVTAT